jgi:hypothetical protein
MIKMQSLKRHPWDGGFKQKGDEFHAVDEMQARTAVSLGWATLVEEKKATVAKTEKAAKVEEEKPETEPPKRKYTRRDMTAE